MKRAKYTHILLISLILGLFLIDCKKFVEIPLPRNAIVTTSVFRDSADATAAILGIYINIMGSPSISNMMNGLITTSAGLSSDELYSNTGATDDLQFYSNSLSATKNGTVGIIWQSAYQFIYQANACIEGLENSTSINSNAKNQLLGEAKLIRALCYFNLVNIYGDVPLITTTDFKINSVFPRTKSDSVYQQIISDLVSSQQLMPTTYLNNKRTRPNRYAASALLARVYLYQGQWLNAKTAASDVISSSSFSLESSLKNVFLDGSKEAIWQIRPIWPGGYETPEGVTIVPGNSSTIPSYGISNNLLNAFESGDSRRINWVDSNLVNSQTYYYPKKYKFGHDNSSSPIEDYMVFRLAEQYLIRAEAENKLNDLTNSANDLNMVRNRANLANVGALSQDSLFKAIQHERQVELFSEWGNRWFDLKRTGNINTVMNAVTPTKGGAWQTAWQLYPIPFGQLHANPFLTQNPNY